MSTDLFEVYGSRMFVERMLMASLAPLTGARAIGTALVHASGADVELPAASFAYPFMAGAAGKTAVDFAKLVKTRSAALTSLREWASPPFTVTAAGTEVPIVAAVGGVGYNLPAGTQLLWSPFVAGVEGVSLVQAPLADGTALTVDGTAASVVLFDEIAGKDTGIAAFRAKVQAFPALVIVWMSTRRKGELTKAGSMRIHTFRVLAFASSLAGLEPRRNTAKSLIDGAERLLQSTVAVDTCPFCSMPIELAGAGKLASDDGSIVDYLDVEVPVFLERFDARTFTAWLTTQQAILSTVTAAYPDIAAALTFSSASASL